MFLLTVNSFFTAKAKLHETERTALNQIKIFFAPRMITNILIVCLFITVFCMKSIYLTKDPFTLVYTKTTEGFLTMGQEENYTIVKNYELVIVLETFIIFCLFFRVILMTMDFPRPNVFFLYLYRAFSNIAVYLLMIILILFSMAIFANNLWGEYYDSYRDLAASLCNTLLFTIGHYQKQIFTSQYTIWNIIFTLYFFVVVIYFILASFVGIFLESYRMNSLEHGYCYDLRKKQDDKKKRKKEE